MPGVCIPCWYGSDAQRGDFGRIAQAKLTEGKVQVHMSAELNLRKMSFTYSQYLNHERRIRRWHIARVGMRATTGEPLDIAMLHPTTPNLGKLFFLHFTREKE